MFPNFAYRETSDRHSRPQGDGWEYWSDRVTLDDQGKEVTRVSVWRRDADIYGKTETAEIQE